MSSLWKEGKKKETKRGRKRERKGAQGKRRKRKKMDEIMWKKMVELEISSREAVLSNLEEKIFKTYIDIAY